MLNTQPYFSICKLSTQSICSSSIVLHCWHIIGPLSSRQCKLFCHKESLVNCTFIGKAHLSFWQDDMPNENNWNIAAGVVHCASHCFFCFTKAPPSSCRVVFAILLGNPRGSFVVYSQWVPSNNKNIQACVRIWKSKISRARIEKRFFLLKVLRDFFFCFSATYLD